MSSNSIGSQAINEGLDIATMLELSLAIGKSLDLQCNAEAFFSQILSRLNLSAISLFVRVERLEGADTNVPRYCCCSSIPRLNGAESAIPYGGPVAAALRVQEIKELNDSEVETLKTVLQGHPIDEGALVGFAHGEDLLILLHVGWRQTPYPKWQLSQLHLILTKFAQSIEGCLDHELLRRESARRIQLQEQLIQAQRLEALGLLAGGMAHDLNNIITPLLGYPALVRPALPEGSLARVDLDTIEEAAGRAASIIEGMLGTTSPAVARSTQVGLNASIEDYLRSPEFQAIQNGHAGVTVQSDLQAKAQVRGTRQCVERVLMNLVHNAFEALGDSGTLRIQSRDVVHETALSGYQVVPPGTYGLLRVEDNGLGIPPDVFERVFEPFVSTKPSTGKFRGLGLAVVSSLVNDMGGYLDLKSSAEGTTFDLYLPYDYSPPR